MSSYREKKIENFITNGGNINSKVPSMGELPIYLAIKYGYDALFYRIIEHANLDIYTHLGRGNTALQHAMIYDRAEYVQKILLYHKTSEPDTDGDIFYEQIPYNINAQNSHGETALTTAIFINKYVELLLENGASPNTVDYAGKTPFYYAIESQSHEENSTIIRQLIDHGARIDDMLFIRDNNNTIIAHQSYLNILNRIDFDDERIYEDIVEMLTPPPPPAPPLPGAASAAGGKRRTRRKRTRGKRTRRKHRTRRKRTRRKRRTRK